MANWTKTPNAIFAAIPRMCPAEMRITFVLVRQIYGHHRKQVRLTYRELMDLTGLGSRSSINTGIQRVLSRGFFKRDKNRLIWRPSAPAGDGIHHEKENRLTASGKERRTTSPRTKRNGRPAISPEAAMAVLDGKPGVAHKQTASALAESVPLPAGLDREPFRTLWSEFLAHLRESGRAMPVRSAQHNLARLASVGREEAEARLRRSLERDWLGLFYENDEKHYRRPNRDRISDSDEGAWQLVCKLSSAGKLTELPQGNTRKAVLLMGEERFYRMQTHARHFVKKEFMEMLRYAKKKNDG